MLTRRSWVVAILHWSERPFRIHQPKSTPESKQSTIPLKACLHWEERECKNEFFFSVWTLNWILYEPICKRCRFRFRYVIKWTLWIGKPFVTEEFWTVHKGIWNWAWPKNFGVFDSKFWRHRNVASRQSSMPWNYSFRIDLFNLKCQPGIVVMRKNYTALRCIGVCLLLEISETVQVVW